MKYAWERESDNGLCTITAMPEDYDAHPTIQVLNMDNIPRLVSSDRLAVSCILAFGYYASGALKLMSPVSAELAHAATSLLEPAAVVIPSIDYNPKAITYGSNVFKLSVADSDVQLNWNGFGSAREFELRMTPIDATYTSSFSDETFTIPTNAGLIVPQYAGWEERLLPFVAQAVLLAEDLDVGTIVLPTGTVRSPKLSKVAALLETCGLQLKFASVTHEEKG